MLDLTRSDHFIFSILLHRSPTPNQSWGIITFFGFNFNDCFLFFFLFDKINYAHFSKFCACYFCSIWLHHEFIVNLLDPELHSKVPVKLGKSFHHNVCNSSTTTLRDQEVPSPNSLCNRLCLLTITWGDGTRMDASSISEEDVVEICITRGHTHPLGMLHYLAAESIILFGTAADSCHASHSLVDVMELHDETVMVWTMALLEAHVAAFTSMWCPKPTTGDGELHTPP